MTCSFCGDLFLRRKSSKAVKSTCKSCGPKERSLSETGVAGKPTKCIDCHVPVWRGSKRCRACNLESRLKPKILRFCVDCGVALKSSKSQRCLKCHNKKQDKGLSKERAKFNASKQWNKVRTACFFRDSYTCRVCNKVGGYLNCHHIKHYSTHKELRLSLSNLLTVCVSCHKEIHFGKNK